MQQRLANIREKLDRLRQADSGMRVHGAYPGTGHAYIEKPPFDAEALARFEAEHGTTLPEELRAFVQTIHSGGPGPGYGMTLWGDPAKLRRPFPYTLDDFAALAERRRTERYATLDDTSGDEDEDAWPPGYGFLQLSHQGCGVFDVIVVTGPLRGSVWYYDQAWGPCTFGSDLPGFFDWYERWLDQNLRPDSLARL